MVVHTVRSEATGDSLRSREPRALWEGLDGEMARAFDYGVDKVAGVMAFARFDPRSRTNLGEADLGAGGLALVGGDSMRRWPTTLAEIPRLFADGSPIDPATEADLTGLRGTAWAATATGMGSLLHELGHTFGLGHSADVRSAMLRGFDALNRRFVAVEPPQKNDPLAHPVAWEDATHWDAFEAARLSLSPWFQPDGYHGLRFPSALPPRVAFEGDEVVVSAPYGLGFVGAMREGKPGVIRDFKGGKTARLRRSELGEGDGDGGRGGPERERDDGEAAVKKLLDAGWGFAPNRRKGGPANLDQRNAKRVVGGEAFVAAQGSPKASPPTHAFGVADSSRQSLGKAVGARDPGRPGSAPVPLSSW